MAYDTVDEALTAVERNPRPLAAYLFHPSRRVTARVAARLSCGGVSINDTLVHFANENLPFGGIGPSGQGAYHGAAGFLAFSHRRGTLEASPFSVARQGLSPPYGRLVEAFTQFATR